MTVPLSELEKSFKVLKILGQGSYGRVYLCRYLKPKKGVSELVAIKRIECESVEQVNSFLKEIVEIRDLEHSNIVKYHDGFIDRNESCFFVNIVMEYLPGFQICDILEYFEKNFEGDHKPVISERFIINLLSHMVDALNSVHGKNIIHRDISTNNIMVFVKNRRDSSIFNVSRPLSPFRSVEETEERTPQTPKLNYTIPELVELPSSYLQFKLLDFGFVTRKLSEQALVDSYEVGTPDFQSPEILTRKSYNEATDIWSLGGVILNFALGKQAHVYATLTEQKSTSSPKSSPVLKEQPEVEEDQLHPLYHVLIKRGYSSRFLNILFEMLQIDPEKRISTSDLKKRVDAELLDLVKEKEKEMFEKNRMERELKIRITNEKTRNIPIFKSQTIVSVNRSTNLSIWNWREHKMMNSKSTILNAHSWTISDIMSLSPGEFFSMVGKNNNNEDEVEIKLDKMLLVSGGSRTNLIGIDGQKMLEEENDDDDEVEEGKDRFSKVLQSFKSEARVEVLCPIYENESSTHTFSMGLMNSTIEVWKCGSSTTKKDDGKKISKLCGHSDSVTTLCSFNRGKNLASGGKDRTVKIWNLEKSVAENTIKDTKYITGIHFYEKKNLLSFSNSYGMSLKFYDIRDMPRMTKNLRLASIALTQFITGFQFVADHYVCVGDNLRLNCYDIRYLGEDVSSDGSTKKCWVKKFPVNDIMLLEDKFAVCSREGLIKVFDVGGVALSTMEEDVGGMFESRTCICRL